MAQFHSNQTDHATDLVNGFVFAMRHALDTKLGKVLLYTARKDSLAPGNVVYEAIFGVLGSDLIKLLFNNRTIRIGDDLTIYWETTGTQRKHGIGQNFIAFGAIVSPADMQTIISDRRTQDSVFVPFKGEELSSYLANYSASQLI